MWNHNFLLKLSIIHKRFQFYCNLYIICVNNFILSPICYSINYLQSLYFNLRFILTSPPSFALLTNERVINQSINHLYSHKPYTTVQRRHTYTYNKYWIDINIYYGFSLLHIFSLVLQPWMSAYIRKTDGVYISVPKNDKNMDDKTLASLNQWLPN